MITDAYITALFITGFILTGVWLICCWLLFLRLENQHYERWVEFDKPTFFNLKAKFKQHFKESLLVCKFAIGKQPDNFNDMKLSLIIWTLRIIFPTIHLVWVALIFGTLFRS